MVFSMTSMNIESLRFSKIETTANLRGDKVTSYYSFPEPVGIEEVRRIDAALVRAFGNDGTCTEATIWPPNPYTVLTKR